MAKSSLLSFCSFLVFDFVVAGHYSTMTSAQNSQHAQMSCPAGGKFYTCNDSGSSQFIGCCGVDPCSKNGCPAGELKSASFNTSYIPPDQQCEAGKFFTCNFTEPPFWGCCNSDACKQEGCPRNDLSGAFLSNNPVKVSPYLSGAPSSTSGVNSTLGSSSPPDAHHHNGTPVGIIVGAALGGFALTLLSVFGLFYLYRRRSTSKPGNSSKHASQGTDAALVPMRYEDNKDALSPTLGYSTLNSIRPDSGVYGGSSQYQASPPMSIGTSPDSFGRRHVRNSTVSSPEAPHTHHSTVGSPILAELDGVATVPTIAELPAENGNSANAPDEAASVRLDGLGVSNLPTPQITYSPPPP